MRQNFFDKSRCFFFACHADKPCNRHQGDRMKSLAALVFLGLFASQGWASNQVRECTEKPDFISRGRLLANLKALPPIVFVARKASYFVENKQTGKQIQGEHVFNKSSPRIVCADTGFAASESFSIYAPTLINLSDSQKMADVYWQFHMTVSPTQLGIWNRKSLIYSKTADLEEGLAKTGAQSQFRQTAHDQFELLLSREDGAWSETLLIEFDGMLRIP